jgi:hypothetical protein
LRRRVCGQPHGSFGNGKRHQLIVEVVFDLKRRSHFRKSSGHRMANCEGSTICFASFRLMLIHYQSFG